eukprot:GFKZ01013932.1.p4 GENE.GFKZ01013932.1~~GFKZ01013932.1.p4  ORF type:complete len:102 (-),score=6.04 GFKZ01013932.1:1783-2088(-)
MIHVSITSPCRQQAVDLDGRKPRAAAIVPETRKLMGKPRKLASIQIMELSGRSRPRWNFVPPAFDLLASQEHSLTTRIETIDTFLTGIATSSGCYVVGLIF